MSGIDDWLEAQYDEQYEYDEDLEDDGLYWDDDEEEWMFPDE